MELNELDSFFPEYAEVIKYIGVRNDPFPNVPPDDVNYWADNRRVFNAIRDLVISSFLFATSKMYIFWGPIGVGKSFAAKYLCKAENRKEMFGLVPKHLVKDQEIIMIKAVQPRRSGELTSSIYRNIVSKFLEFIMEDGELTKELIASVKDIDNIFIRKAFSSLSVTLRSFFGGDVRDRLHLNEGYKYIMDHKNKIGKIKDINELSEILYLLYKIISTKYDRFTLIIDELDFLESSTVAERYQFSDLLKSIYGKINTGLNMILIYTFDTYRGVLGTLQPAATDRISEIIEFNKIDNKDDLIEYITDCIKQRGEIDPNQFITEEVIELYSIRLLEFLKALSFRDINKEIHRFIAGCYRIASEAPDFDISNFIIDKRLYEIYTQFSI